jgi:hypothetical protein
MYYKASRIYLKLYYRLATMLVISMLTGGLFGKLIGDVEVLERKLGTLQLVGVTLCLWPGP